MAPVIAALDRHGGPGTARVVNTGQHSAEMLQPLFDFFGIRVDHQLDVMRAGSSLTSLNARLLESLGGLLASHRPDAVVVQGDTSSALQMGIAAFLAQVPVAHVEAGLRTEDLANPFPEEFNRSVLGRLSRWHFAPTPRAAKRLQSELVPGTVQMTGNTVVDAVQWSIERLQPYRQRFPDALPAQLDRRFAGLRRIVVTMHRRENWGPGIRDVARAIATVLEARPDTACVWSLHPNPAVAEDVRGVLGGLPEAQARRLALVPPLPYPEMIWVMQQAYLLLTDSGGIQEESVSLDLPVLVARDETERQEVIECGAGKLVGTDHDVVTGATLELLDNAERYDAMAHRSGNPFGDGRASDHLAERMLHDLDGHPG